MTDDYDSSEEESKRKHMKPSFNTMNLRERDKKKYYIYISYFSIFHLYTLYIYIIYIQYIYSYKDLEEASIRESEEEEEVEKEEGEQTEIYTEGIFNPDIDVILWRKENDDGKGEKKMEYLVKLKGVSYLHVKWVQEQDIVKGVSGKGKLNRFISKFESQLMENVIYNFLYYSLNS